MHACGCDVHNENVGPRTVTQAQLFVKLWHRYE